MKLHLAVAACAVALATSAPAFASTAFYDLSVADPSAGLAAGPYGQVKVTENGGALDFLVTLDGAFRIHGGNDNHDAFTFDLIGAPAVTISALTAGFAREAGTSFSEPPLGSFFYSIDCTTACGAGYPGGFVGPLSFTVTANSGTLSLASLGTTGGVYFSSDIVDPNGKTGNVGAIPGVPEPATWAMMLLGMGGLGAALRQRRRPQMALA
jgi:hypothetical protein